ncbi:MAG: hypothetical protein GY725_06030 [bacterium]|nr:hypothetical protein [bacterium]
MAGAPNNHQAVVPSAERRLAQRRAYEDPELLRRRHVGVHRVADQNMDEFPGHGVILRATVVVGVEGFGELFENAEEGEAERV